MAQTGDPRSRGEMHLLTDSLAGTALPSTFNPGCVLAVALSPALGAIWVLHAKPQTFSGPSDPCLSVYDACHLACLGTWQLGLKDGLHRVSYSSVAVCLLSASITCVLAAALGCSSCLSQVLHLAASSTRLRSRAA